MDIGSDVLERSVLHPGKTFIKAGEECGRAYVVQKGMIRAFTLDGEEGEEQNKIEVATYGPGSIIGEIGLVLDEVMSLSFEAVETTTVVTITRQDFEKKLQKSDPTVKTILSHLMNKLKGQDTEAAEKAQKRAQIDDQAYDMVRALTVGLDPEKQREYEDAILPHMNGVIRVIKELKAKERHEKQALEASKIVAKAET